MVETITKLGTWGGIFGRRTKAVKAIADDLRALIVGLHPDVVEVPRKGDKAVSYGFGEKRNSEAYCYLAPHRDRVNLGFMFGAALDDPNRLLEGTGKNMRHVKIFDQETARAAKIAQLVHLAVEERLSGLETATKAKKKPAAKASPKKRATKKEKAV